DYTIRSVGDDEIGQLIDSFNRMTADLRESAAELERRRRYTETLLLNVSAGVVALDDGGPLTTLNPCAERLLGVGGAEALGRHVREASPGALVRGLDDLLAVAARPRESRSTLKVETASGETELMMTASPLGEAVGEPLGTVLFFEDVSQI